MRLAPVAVLMVARASAACWLDPAWPESAVTVRPGLIYGQSFNNLTGRQQPLSLDLYSPPASDQRLQRPAVVLAHGGAFVGGSSTSDGIPNLARALAARGLLAVSINYRLTGSYWGTQKHFPGCGGQCCPGTASDQYAIDASRDAKAAVRYVRTMAREWRVDPTRLAVGGDSAGAFTSLFTGYVGAVGEGSSGNPGLDSSVSLVISISGELAMFHRCRGVTNGNSTAATPYGCTRGVWNHTAEIGARPGQPWLSIVHGTADAMVPYIEARAMQMQANATGLPNQLVTVLGGGHVPMEQLLASHMPELLGFMVAAMKLNTSECPSPHRD